MDRGTWWATLHGVAKSGTRLSDFTFTIFPNNGFNRHLLMIDCKIYRGDSHPLLYTAYSCPPPNFICLKSNVLCDDIRR